jgi:tRNA-uridine 2-sulfurtransferase
MKNSKEKILISLSGGVDSAVCAWLLKKQGFEVVAVYFEMLEKSKSYDSAKKVAEFLQIKLIKKSLKKEFKKEIINYFVKEYEHNRTPNPCVVCNRKIKMRHLLQAAKKLGAKRIATGHYAGIKKNAKGYLLKKAVDKKKDQSYFLYQLGQKELKKVIFPLEKFKKEQVREIAKENKIPADLQESQNACFFSGRIRLTDFLGKKLELVPGNIENEKGDKLGKHRGLPIYTLGQRYGLGLSGGPFYVIGKKTKGQILIVSKNRNNQKLRPKAIVIKNASWTLDNPKIGKKYFLRTRYQGEQTKGKLVEKISRGKYLAKLDGLQWAVVPGQSLVVYDKKTVVGGGIIEKTV